MASTTARATGGAASGSKMFPLQLARGVLNDLFDKEFSRIIFPGDGAKEEAFQAAKAALNRRLALITSQLAGVEAVQVTDGVLELLEAHWQYVCEHRAFSSIGVSALGASLWLETLIAIVEAACATSSTADGYIRNGGLLVSAALNGRGMAVGASAIGPAVLEWWSDEVCCGRLRVTDAWGNIHTPGDLERGTTPLHIIADYGLVSLIPLAVKKGCSVNGSFHKSSDSSPARWALHGSHYDVIWALIDQGMDLLRPYDGDGWPLAVAIFGAGKGHSVFLADLLRRRPEIASALRSEADDCLADFLTAAIFTKDPAVVELALSAGARIDYHCRRTGSSVGTLPSVALAFKSGDPKIIELMITEGRALEGWKDKYDEEALSSISFELAALAISAYPPNPRYAGNPADLVKHNPRAMECLKLALAAGFTWSWGDHRHNSLLSLLYPLTEGPYSDYCILEQPHALEILKLFHVAGFEVVQRFIATFEDESRRGVTLLHAAASAGHELVMDWCLGVLGVPTEPPGFLHHPPLVCALLRRSIGCTKLMLRKYHARAAYPEQALCKQPVFNFCGHLVLYTDAEAHGVLEALLEREPGLFALECFNEASVAQSEASVRPNEVRSWHSLCLLATFHKPRTLEFLLTKSPPGVAAMASRRALVPCGFNALTRQERLTPAQAAADHASWDCLSVLLRHTDCRVTQSFERVPSVMDLVKLNIAKGRAPPRALSAALEARAKKELEVKAEKAKTAAASQAAGAVTNAFEEPPVKPRDEKKKAKKKAAKKKARAKKTAVASAGAGDSSAPGGDGDSEGSSGDDDGDDDGGHEEEPEDNLVDSRYAPSLDLIMEQMGLKEKK